MQKLIVDANTCQVWKFKPEKIKETTLIGPVFKGGLNMVNFADAKKSLNAPG